MRWRAVFVLLELDLKKAEHANDTWRQEFLFNFKEIIYRPERLCFVAIAANPVSFTLFHSLSRIVYLILFDQR